MGSAVATMFGSKKFLAALAGVVAVVLADVGMPIPEETIYPVVAYIVGQGIADHGKEREKVRDS